MLALVFPERLAHAGGSTLDHSVTLGMLMWSAKCRRVWQLCFQKDIKSLAQATRVHSHDNCVVLG